MATIKHRVGIVGDINTIYRTMHEPAGLDGWWATRTTGVAQEGEILALQFADVVTLSFQVVTLKENALVRLRCSDGPGPWQDCELTFAMTAGDDQVWVDLMHQNDAATDDEFLYFNTKWPCYLLSLRDLIEHGEGRPYPDDTKIHFGD